jgi:CheY-like chemotaxis protein
MTSTSERLETYPATRTMKTVAVITQAARSEVLDTVLSAGGYDAVFMESFDRAYSRIKRVQPHLIVVCLDIDRAEGFHVLTMLKADSETASIPLITYFGSSDEQPSAHKAPEHERLADSQDMN